MKNVLMAAIAVASCTSLLAAPADHTALKNYAAKSFASCPGSVIKLEPKEPGPLGFNVFLATQTSSDTSCGSQKLLLFSPSTGQILIGSVFLIPPDNRPLSVRIAEQTSALLKKPVKAVVAPFPLPDGLKAVSIIKDTPYGPFSYHAYLDAAERFLIVGSRGNLNLAPAKGLRDALNISTAARRGNKNAKVEIIELSDFQCPTCARAHKRIEPIIAKNLAKIDYKRIDLPLFDHHEWAMSAALGARALQRVAPAKYWKYVDFIFENQESIGKMKFDAVLHGFCDDHDIDWAAVEKIYRSNSERMAVLEQVSTAFDIGVVSTPTFIVNGQVLGFGAEGSFTVDTIRKAIAGAK